MACCQGQVFGPRGVIGYVSSACRAPFRPLWYDERCRRETIEETKRGRAILTITFSDVACITPGDDEEYARVLVGLWQDPGVWQDDDTRAMCRFLEERRVPDAAAQWVYDNLPHTDAHRAVLSQPGLGEKRITEAARVIVSAITFGGAKRDPRMALSNVFDNPSLTRGAIDAALSVANLLPDFIVYSMLMGGALTGDDVQALWGSRREKRSYMGLGRDFVEPAMRGGSAPDSLVDEWLDGGEYAPHAAAYATNVSEDDVLRIVHSVDNPWRDRALMNPVLSSEALWREMRQRRGLGDGLTYIFSNESAHPAMLEAGARDSECKTGWESIAGNPVATRAAFETLLFTGGNDKIRLLQEAGHNPGFPPGLVWDVYRVFGAGPALNFRGAPSDLVREVAGFYADRRFSRGYSTGMTVIFHRNCPADVRSNLAWDDRSLWPLVADDAYRGRHAKKTCAPSGADVDVSSLYLLCG